MSKTFKSAGNPCASISIAPSADGVRTVHMHGIESTGVTVSTADGPALALAILEAAGFTEESPNFGTAVHELGLAIKEQDYITAEAEAQAELEAEALELRNAYFGDVGSEREWSDLTIGAQSTWITVARRAREINKEDSNA